MEIKIKQFPQNRMCREFFDVVEFLKTFGTKGTNKNWHWARWEWLLGHTLLDESTLPSIGLFMDGDKIAGLVTHDMGKEAYILLDPQYAFLKPQMVDYAAAHLSHDGVSSLFADEDDRELISVLKEKGYAPTVYKECAVLLNCGEKLNYSLDDKYRVSDFAVEKSVDDYIKVIHKGFEDEGEPAKGLTESHIPKRPHENRQLSVFILAPNKEYVAHCGTWYSPGTDICYIEPVVTIPGFRGLGLGKAAVYESINRCIALGAKKAMVISDQTFYARLGFEPYAVCRLWEKKR